MTVPDSPQKIEPAYDEMDEVLQNITTSISKFYVYKYLVDQEGIEEFAFDKMQLTNTMKDALYTYGIHATLGEAGNAPASLKWVGRDIGEMYDGGRVADIRAYENTIEEAVSRVSEEILMRASKDKMLEWPKKKKMADISSFYRSTGLHKQLQQYLEDVSWFFGADWEERGSVLTGKANSGWRGKFGGDPWASVADTTALYDEFGADAYIDIMLSVEHNNGNFLDKWKPRGESDVEEIAKSVLGVPEMEEFIPPERRAFNDGLVNALLTLAREADLKPLLDIARLDDNRLRRVRGRLPDQQKEIGFDLREHAPEKIVFLGKKP